MISPHLNFTRTLRLASDVGLSFYPSCDPEHHQVIIRQASLFLLTDLFLVCSHMTRAEKAERMLMQREQEGEMMVADMWLLYPPLAGKHLRVTMGSRTGELEVTVMKREKLTIRLQSDAAAEEWKVAFEAAIAFGTASAFFFLASSWVRLLMMTTTMNRWSTLQIQ